MRAVLLRRVILIGGLSLATAGCRIKVFELQPVNLKEPVTIDNDGMFVFSQNGKALKDLPEALYADPVTSPHMEGFYPIFWTSILVAGLGGGLIGWGVAAAEWKIAAGGAVITAGGFAIADQGEQRVRRAVEVHNERLKHP